MVRAQVINGVCAIMAVQKVGLSIAQGTWSALSIFVSFIWGAFIFHERVRSLPLSFAGARGLPCCAEHAPHRLWTMHWHANRLLTGLFQSSDHAVWLLAQASS